MSASFWNCGVCPPVGAGPLPGTTTDVEKRQYCNPATDTLWVEICAFDLSVFPPTQTVISDTDTGIPCTAGSDAEVLCLCDDNQEFLRRLDIDAGVVTVVDTELDGVTTYVPVGAVRKCVPPEIDRQCMQVTVTDWLIDNEQDNDCGSSSQPVQWAPDDPPADYEILSFSCDGVETVTTPVTVAYPPTVAFTVVDPPAPTLGGATVTGDASSLLGQPINVFSMLPATGATLIGQSVCTGAIFAAGETTLTWAPPLPALPAAGAVVQLDNVNTLFTNLAAALAGLSGEAWVRTLHPTCANVVEVIGSTKQYTNLIMRRTSDGQVFNTNVAPQNVVVTRVYRVVCFEKDGAGVPVGTDPVYLDYDDPTLISALTPEQIAALTCCPCDETQASCQVNTEECYLETIGGGTTGTVIATEWTSYEVNTIGALGTGGIQENISLANPVWTDVTDPISPDNDPLGDRYVTSNEDGSAGMFSFKANNLLEDFYYWDKDTGAFLGRAGFGALDLVGTAGFDFANSSLISYDPVLEVLWVYALTSGGVGATVDEVELLSIDVSNRAAWGTDGSYDLLAGAGVLPGPLTTTGDVTNHGQIILDQPLSPEHGLRISGADGSAGFPGVLTMDHSTNTLYWATNDRGIDRVNFHVVNHGTHLAPITPTINTGQNVIADVGGYSPAIKITGLDPNWSFPGTINPAVRAIVISNGNVAFQTNAGSLPSYRLNFAEFVDGASVDAVQSGTDPLIREPDLATEFPSQGTTGYWVNLFRAGQALPSGTASPGTTQAVKYLVCATPTGGTTWYNTETNAFSTTAPTGTKLNCSQENSQVEVVCMCDDITGDGLNVVQYVDVYEVSVDGGVLTSVLLGTFTDNGLQTPYVPVNGVKCESIGSNVIGASSHGLELTGSTWSRPALTQSVTVCAVTVASPGTSFVTTPAGVINLVEGECLTWSVETDVNTEMLVGDLDIEAGAADLLHITYTMIET